MTLMFIIFWLQSIWILVEFIHFFLDLYSRMNYILYYGNSYNNISFRSFHCYGGYFSFLIGQIHRLFEVLIQREFLFGWS